MVEREANSAGYGMGRVRNQIRGIRQKGEFCRGARKGKIGTTWRTRGEAGNRGGEGEAAWICFT